MVAPVIANVAKETADRARAIVAEGGPHIETGALEG
jgi:hypothetical protein